MQDLSDGACGNSSVSSSDSSSSASLSVSASIATEEDNSDSHLSEHNPSEEFIIDQIYVQHYLLAFHLSIRQGVLQFIIKGWESHIFYLGGKYGGWGWRDGGWGVRGRWE